MCITYVQWPERPREGTEAFGTGIRGGCDSHNVSAGTVSLGPQQEQQVLFTTEEHLSDPSFSYVSALFKFLLIFMII